MRELDEQNVKIFEIDESNESLSYNCSLNVMLTSNDKSKSVTIMMCQSRAKLYSVLLLKKIKHWMNNSWNQYKEAILKQQKISCSRPSKNIKGTVKIIRATKYLRSTFTTNKFKQADCACAKCSRFESYKCKKPILTIHTPTETRMSGQLDEISDNNLYISVQ